MPSSHLLTGIKGEQIAERHLRGKGYEILEKNWRFEKCEVDLICRIGNELVFAEVKTRSTDYFGFPEESVSLAKQKKLCEAAEAYLSALPLNLTIRFDIVSVILQQSVHKVYHIEDAFFPGLYGSS